MALRKHTEQTTKVKKAMSKDIKDIVEEAEREAEKEIKTIREVNKKHGIIRNGNGRSN